MALKFTLSKDKDLSEVFNYNLEIFADNSDFTWKLDNISQKIKEGWEFFTVKFENEVVAAILVHADSKTDTFVTSNTPIRLNYQGNGFSHAIKEHFEEMAIERGLNRVTNLCRMDNFRGIGLNESHGYKKTGRKFGVHNEVEEWAKSITNK
jgi:hypothetical protein